MITRCTWPLAVVSLVVLCLAATATAQDQPFTVDRLPPLEPMERLEVGGGPPLHLEEVLGTSAQSYPPLLQARQKLAEARGKQLSAQGAFDLKLSAKGFATPIGYYDYQRLDVMVEQPTPVWGATLLGGYRIGRGLFPVYYGNYETLQGGELRLGLRLPLLQGRATDENRAGLRLGDLGFQEKRADIDAKVLQTGATVAEAYWKWVAAGLKYKVAAEQLALAEARDQQLARQVRSGALPAIDLLENRRAIMARRQELVSTRRKLEAAAIKLSLYLRDPEGRPRLPDPGRVPDSIPLPPDLSPEEAQQALQRALEDRPELARERARLQQAEVELELAQNNLAPSLEVELHSSQDLGSTPVSQKKKLGPWIVEGGLVFKLPLQQRKARGKHQSATAKRQQQLLELDFLRDQITNEVQDALSATLAAQEKVEITGQGALVSLEVARAERRRLELGSTDLIKLNLVEQYAYTAQSKYIEAQADLKIARARLRAASAQP